MSNNEGRYYIVPANGWIDDDGDEQNDSAHVIDRQRWNEFGERFCIVSHVTYDEAERVAAELNRRD